jgi:hypothetical protein
VQFVGANIRLSPLGYEEVPEGKMTKGRITALLKPTLQYNHVVQTNRMQHMNISVIIPQVLYDLIARILPGVFFSILALLSFPEWAGYVSPLASTEKNNFVQSLGQGFIHAALCYFLESLVFSAFPG